MRLDSVGGSSATAGKVPFSGEVPQDLAAPPWSARSDRVALLRGGEVELARFVVSSPGGSSVRAELRIEHRVPVEASVLALHHQGELVCAGRHLYRWDQADSLEPLPLELPADLVAAAFSPDRVRVELVTLDASGLLERHDLSEFAR